MLLLVLILDTAAMGRSLEEVGPRAEEESFGAMLAISGTAVELVCCWSCKLEGRTERESSLAVVPGRGRLSELSSGCSIVTEGD